MESGLRDLQSKGGFKGIITAPWLHVLQNILKRWIQGAQRPMWIPVPLAEYNAERGFQCRHT